MNKKIAVIGLNSLLLTACATDPYTGEYSMSNTAKGGAIGAAVGAGTGTLFGGNDLKNAGFGALAGGAVGAAVGAYMDRQQRQMEQSLQGTGIEVQRTAQNTLNLNMPSSITFDLNSAHLTSAAQSSLDTVANVLNQYPDSAVTITGHTDDTGPDGYNQKLSEQRAASVSSYLTQRNVNYGRLRTQGLGETMPKYPNTSEANRAQNRRVELTIVANNTAGGQQTPQQQQNYPQQQGYPQQQQNYPQQSYPPQPQTYPQQPMQYSPY